MNHLKDILNQLEVSKEEWIKNGSWYNRRKKRVEEEIEILVKDTLGSLEQLKAGNPKKFEEFYWKTCMIVERDNVYTNSYGGIITSIALAPSAIGAFFAVIGALDGDITRYDLIIIACVAVMAVGVILLTIPYLRCLVATREHSYYRFLLKALEDIRSRDGIKNVQEKIDVNDKKANEPMV